VDPATGRVFVANDFSNSVSVIDGRATPPAVTGSPIAVGTNPFGVAVDPATGRVFVANAVSNSVSVIDGRATPPAVIGGPIAVGSGPFGVTVDPATGRVFVANSGSNSVSVIDGRATPPAVIGTPIAVGALPQGVAVDPATGRVFVANASSNSVSVIDAASLSVVETLSGLNSPRFTAAADPATRRVFIAETGANRVAVFHDETTESLADALAGGNVAAILSAIATARDAVIGAVNSHTDTATAPANALAGRTNLYTRWWFAEGDTSDGFQEYLALFSETGQTITIHYFLETGPGPVVTVHLPAGTRVTEDVNVDVGAGHKVSVRIDGTAAFFAERALYFKGKVGAAGDVNGGHDGSGQHN
jgi:YVTN family beta-propeller protein